MSKRAIALIDGEHYAPVVQAALDRLAADPAYELVGAVYIGGTEKLRDDGALDSFSVPVVREPDPVTAIVNALALFRAVAVVDLSDEPVLGYTERFKYACHVLRRGASYAGPDFHFDPPIFENIVRKPSVSIIGTGKRTGKTAVSAFACRELKKQGFAPCVVAMGRGGPERPEVIAGGRLEMTPEFLLAASRQGKHAASDHYEDALMSRVTTVGCRRCGGGMAGSPYLSNVREGAEIANDLTEDFIIFEGSGAAIPPVKTDACVLIAGAGQPEDYITGHFGTYRILLADLVILTMCEAPMTSEEHLTRIELGIRKIRPDLTVIRSVFRPHPLEDVSGRRVFLVTTAPVTAGEVIGTYLEDTYKCRLAGISHNLARRPALERDLAASGDTYDVLLVELKAAAVDVATEYAAAKDLKVVYTDNVPVTVCGGGNDIRDQIIDTAKTARERYAGGKR